MKVRLSKKLKTLFMQGDYLVTSLIEMGTKTSNKSCAVSFLGL